MERDADISLVAEARSLLREGCLRVIGGRIVAANPQAGAILGHSIAGLLETPAGDLLPGAPWDAITEGEVVHEWRETTSAGVQLRCRARTVSGGGAIVVVIDDVTALQATADAEREALRRLAQAQAAGGIGTWELDLGTGSMWGSVQAFRIYGLEPTEDQRMPLSVVQEIPAVEHRERLDAALRSLLAGRAEYDLRFSILRPADGLVAWVHSRGEVRRDASGRPVKVLGTVHDVTRLVESERRAAEAERLAALGQLAGGIAHDFNNVLTAIGGYAALLEADATDAAQAADLAQIREGVDRAAGLVRQLLAFGGRQPREPVVVRPASVVRGLAPMLRRLLGEQVEMAIVTDDTDGRVLADPAQIEQIVVNLAINARDAMPLGGHLWIRTTSEPSPDPTEADDPGWCCLSVTDEGHGIPDDRLAHIFEPFYTTKGPGRGTGMGLAVVHGIVEQSRGRIEVESTVGQGTTVRVWLPAVDQPLAEPPPVMVGAAPAGGHERILLAEDDPAVRALASRVLAAAGYRVVSAADGTTAIRLGTSADAAIDLLVTDLAMPGADGRLVAAELRAANPDAKVLVVSGFDPGEASMGPLPGTFLPKPYDAATLLRAVRAELDRG